MFIRLSLMMFFSAITVFSQVPQIEPGVSKSLAEWRAARYSDVRYKLNLTLEKMSPVLKGTIEISLKVGEKGSGGARETGTRVSEPGAVATGFLPPIILDWRKIAGHEKDSTISNVYLNGVALSVPPSLTAGNAQPDAQARTSVRAVQATPSYEESNEHLIFRDGVKPGENIIKLDFTSPILTSGSAITRYVDKEDGAEYIYSLFVPSDASTAFPVFDQPDLKARFTLSVRYPTDWLVVSNTHGPRPSEIFGKPPTYNAYGTNFPETKPISTYLFAFAAGPFANFREDYKDFLVTKDIVPTDPTERSKFIASFDIPKGQNPSFIYVRKSQAAKFKHHAAEVFRLNREGVKYLETYFDYKFPFPKYDIVLIPEFPFGGMEHAGATFLREDRVIFPQEPTKGDYISRANLIFHETAHQWIGDTVTMKWFDDLWLKEGFAEFMAYKTLEKVMPDANAWKVFYERNKQAAYLTDSTKGTTPIYQEIANLSAAKSAYGNIVYRKAPSFLKQAEFYLGPDQFQTAVRAFLKKHEFANAGWEDLVGEFQRASGKDLKEWGATWIRRPGLPTARTIIGVNPNILNLALLNGQRRPAGHTEVVQTYYDLKTSSSSDFGGWGMKTNIFVGFADGKRETENVEFKPAALSAASYIPFFNHSKVTFVIPNYRDYGYGIFLLDDKSRDYVLKNIQNERDPFLRSMMWGSLWDSVREGELDPKVYVELVVKNLGSSELRLEPRKTITPKGVTLNAESDESTIQSLLSRVSTAMNYYIPAPSIALAKPPRSEMLRRGPRNARASASGDLQKRVEAVLIERMQNAPTLGQRITFYRAFLNVGSTEKARLRLREIFDLKFEIRDFKLRTKDKFDIVTRLLILNDPAAPALLDELIKSDTSDEARRYAYAARAGVAKAENKAKFWSDYTTNKDISESWIEASLSAFNSTKHADLTLPYLDRALKELPNLKRNRKIFFVGAWLSAFIGGQRSEEALGIVNKFLADNPGLDKDLRLKILENADLIERAVKIRSKWAGK